MTISFPTIRIGDAARHAAMAVYPLFLDVNGQVEYRLADEALGDNGVVVEEIDDAGSVPEVIVKNMGDQRVLFLEGQELIGAKQNRIVNTSMLIPARSDVRIPVCCVEQKRWQYRSPGFSHEGRYASSRLRSVLKHTVASSIQRGRGHRADQNKIWREVSGLQDQLGVESTTRAMSDTFISCDEVLVDITEKLPYVAGATGLALAIDREVVGIDLFDKPSTCQRVWPCLVRACAVDALGQPTSSGHLAKVNIEQVLDSLKTANWQASPTVGEGQEYRCHAPNRIHASALMLDGALVHASVSPF